MTERRSQLLGKGLLRSVNAPQHRHRGRSSIQRAQVGTSFRSGFLQLTSEINCFCALEAALSTAGLLVVPLTFTHSMPAAHSSPSVQDSNNLKSLYTARQLQSAMINHRRSNALSEDVPQTGNCLALEAREENRKKARPRIRQDRRDGALRVFSYQDKHGQTRS